MFDTIYFVKKKVDGRGAGPGHLAILVDGGRVTSQVKALGDHRFRAVFLPHDSGPHSVDMTFNGLTVPGKKTSLNCNSMIGCAGAYIGNGAP